MILEHAKLISELKASKGSSDEQKSFLTEKINLLEAKLCEAESTILQKDTLILDYHLKTKTEVLAPHQL